MIEEWKQVEGSHYEVSSEGRVRSPWTLLRPVLANNGYRCIYLRFSDGRAKTMTVHRLVAAAFVRGRSETNNVVNHLDGNKENNRAENLEWCTHAHNNSHAVAAGLNIDLRLFAGKTRGNRKLSQEQVCAIRTRLASGAARKDLASEFEVDVSSNIEKRKTWGALE